MARNNPKFGRICFPQSALRLLFALVLLLPLVTPGFSAEYRFLENLNYHPLGSDSSSLTPSPTRIRIDLDGPWSYSIDGGPSGTVSLPAAGDFVGKIIFQRSVEITAEQAQKYRFHVVANGINYTSEITVNNDFVTNHTGGYTGVMQSVPANALQPGSQNLVRIVVGNQLDVRKTLPLRPQPWDPRNYCGVLRDVYLLGTPAVYIRDVAFRTDVSEKTASAHVVARVSVDARQPSVTESTGAAEEPGAYGFYMEIFDRISGISIGRSNVMPLAQAEEGMWGTQAEINVDNPKLWSPDTPDLYLVRCFLVKGTAKENTLVDEDDRSLGIRQVSVTNGHLQLNGKRLQVKGVVWYEDNPASGSALSYEQMERDVVLIRNLGANTVRFIGHPPHPYMLDLCDRYGLLAMEEIPLSQTPGPVLADDSYIDLAGSMLREMILRDRNHPSVIAWGLGDEFESTLPTSRAAVERLVALSRSLDARPTYFGARLLKNDVCSDLVDIAALNLQTKDIKQWKTELEEWRSRHRSQPVIVSKFGTEVQQDNRHGYNDPLSQEAQARFYLQRFDILRSPEYDGGIVWSFNDWRGDRPSLTVNSGDPWIHTLGLVSRLREKRLAYEAVRSIFRGEKFVALPIGGRPSGAPIIYVLAGFIALVGVAYVYNVSRRFRESFNRSVLNSYNFYSDVRDQHTVSFVHTTLLGVAVSLGTAIVVSSILYHFRGSWFLDNLLSIILVSDAVKAAVVRVIWDPIKAIAFVSVAVFAGLVVLSMIVYAVRVFFRMRIFPFHAYTVAMWSASPLVAFILIGMILYRIMDSPAYVIPALLLVAVVHFWVFLRMLKGMSIVFDVFPPKMYAAGILVLLFVFAVVYIYYDSVGSAPMYVAYMYQVMTNTL